MFRKGRERTDPPMRRWPPLAHIICVQRNTCTNLDLVAQSLDVNVNTKAPLSRRNTKKYNL